MNFLDEIVAYIYFCEFDMIIFATHKPACRLEYIVLR